MNSAYVEGIVYARAQSSVWVTVRSHHPSDTVDVIRVKPLDRPAPWWHVGARAAFAGRLRRDHDGLYLEATDCWLDGVHLTSDRNITDTKGDRID